MSMPVTRRIITGHDANGKAIITSDTTLTPANPISPTGDPPTGVIPGFTNLFKTAGVPATNVQGPVEETHGRMIGLQDPSGVFCRIVDFPPTGGQVEDFNIMHRTQSIDFGVVLKGRIKLILDSGEERVCEEGDTVVQRATNHAWKNETNENARMLFVLVPSEPVVNEATNEVLEPTPTSHLYEKES